MTLAAVAAASVVVLASVHLAVSGVGGHGTPVVHRQLSAPLTSPDRPALSDRQQDFADAAREFGVPEAVLLAVSYNLTGWEARTAEQSADGGYGPMDLTTSSAAIVGRGRANHPSHSGISPPAAAPNPDHDTLDTAASLLHEPVDRVRTSVRDNIRGGAAVLASEAGQRPVPGDSVADWYPAVARYSGAATPAGQQAFADDVFDTLRQGASATTSDDENLRVAADPAIGEPNTDREVLRPECPAGLNCRFVPAAYGWTGGDHSDPNNYGNYDPARRPEDGNDIRYIVIHDTEETPGDPTTPYDQAIRAFQNPASQVSAHYVIRSSDGHVTQMVPTRDIAWHTDNWTINAHSIGIEHEGISTQGGTWYTEQMYESSAKLVRYLAAKYHIPLDRKHIIGHDEISPDQPGKLGGAHTDPGPYWDWNYFMRLVTGTGNGPDQLGHLPRAGEVVTINPDYTSNKQPVSACQPSRICARLPAHGTNFVYLHTLPDAMAPLINNRVLHPDDSPGSTAIDDWSDRAIAGRDYVVAGQEGAWTGIWYGGKRAWFYDPGGTMVAAGADLVATPAPGRHFIPLYGRAFPQNSAYPRGIPFDRSWAVTPLPWILPAGQRYAVVEDFPAQNYFARFDAANVSGNHTLVRGDDVYLLLSYNHRLVWAKASDLTVGPA